MRYSAGNTKLRDKVTATVRGLQAKDSGSKPNVAKDNSPKPNVAKDNSKDTSTKNTVKADNTAKPDSTKADAPKNVQKSKKPKSEAEDVIATLLRQYKKEK